MTPKPRKAPIVPTGTVPVESPPAVPLIADTVPAGSVVLLVGTPGSGRSSLLAEWAAAVVHGEPWQGHATRPGRVLYLDLSRKPRDIASMIEAVAGKETPSGSLGVLTPRIDLRDGLGLMQEVIRSGGYGLVLLDALTDLGVPGGGARSASWAAQVAALATTLFDATVAGGSVLLVDECDVRGAIAGAPLGTGADVVLRLERVGGRSFVRPVGPARSGRRRPPAPTSPPVEPVYEFSGVPGNWFDGKWQAADLTPLVSGRHVDGGYLPEAPRL
jgi:hypothetical protein